MEQKLNPLSNDKTPTIISFISPKLAIYVDILLLTSIWNHINWHMQASRISKQTIFWACWSTPGISPQMVNPNTQKWKK